MDDDLLVLDYDSPSKEESRLLVEYKKYIVGQERAIKRVVRSVVHGNALEGSLRNEEQPIGQFFLLGPTGVGKTRIARATAKVFFDSFDALTIINCTELQENHIVAARLLGAPAGYIGYYDTPLLAQYELEKYAYWSDQSNGMSEVELKQLRKLSSDKKRLDSELNRVNKELGQLNKEKTPDNKAKREELATSKTILVVEMKNIAQETKNILEKTKYKPGQYPIIILFDEIDRAHLSIFNVLLQILDRGYITLNSKTDNDGRVVLHNALLFFTSNIGDKKIYKIAMGRGEIGFRPKAKDVTNMRQSIYKTVMAELDKNNEISKPWLSRVGKENVIVCDLLNREQFKEYMKRIAMSDLNEKYSRKLPLNIILIDKAVEYMLQESYDDNVNRALGIRGLLHVFKERISEPLSVIVTKEVVHKNDEVFIDVGLNGKISISKKVRQIKNILEIPASVEQSTKDENFFINRVIATFKIKNK